MRKLILLTAIFSLVFSFAISQKTYNEVTLPQLLQRLRQKDTNMIVVDVRTPGEYYDSSSNYQQSNIGRIKGAINIPLQQFRKDPSTVHQLDAYKNKDLRCYTTVAGCGMRSYSMVGSTPDGRKSL